MTTAISRERVSLSIHEGTHNGNASLAIDNEIVEVLELERLLKIKDVTFYKKTARDFVAVAEYFKKKYDLEGFGNVYYTDKECNVDYIKIAFNPTSLYPCMHEESHGALGFYMSTFDEAIVVAVDGGGNDGYFNIYHATRDGGLKRIVKLALNLGAIYSFMAAAFKDIDARSEKPKHSSAGKFMGLVGYGKQDKGMVDAIVDVLDRRQHRLPPGYSVSTPGHRTVYAIAADLFIGLDPDTRKIDDERELDIAASFQRAWEIALIGRIRGVADKYPNLPIVLSGGCALNIIANRRIEQDLNRDVFVPPNPDDRGLSAGMLLNALKPVSPPSLTYLGLDVMGEVREGGERLDVKKLAASIVSGDIVGVMRGRSEIGPRALGNRSILCYPGYPEMKEILNAKIKKREWFRPFAPVCRLEDVGKFFDRTQESPYMNFMVMVNSKYVDKVPAIVHVDGSARVQTVTREQNEFLYDLLTEIDALTGIGMLLNTSFNVDKQPILAYTDQAYQVFDSTQMDKVVINDQVWSK